MDLGVGGVVTSDNTHIKHQIACEENGPCCLLEGPKSGPFVHNRASRCLIYFQPHVCCVVMTFSLKSIVLFFLNIA